MSATLQGNVPIGSYPAVNVVVRFFTPDTTTEVMKACSPTDASGNFTIYGITPGTYDVGVKAGGYTSTLVEDKVFTEGETTTIDFPSGGGESLGWYGGDVDGNDKIDSKDSAFVTNNYGKRGACWNYPGNWLIPKCPSPPPAGGACYGYVIS